MVSVAPEPSGWLSRAHAAPTTPSQTYCCCRRHAGLCLVHGRDMLSPFLFWKSQRANFCLPQASSVHCACMGFKLSDDKHPECQTCSRSFPFICFQCYLEKVQQYLNGCLLPRPQTFFFSFVWMHVCEEGYLYLTSGT